MSGKEFKDSIINWVSGEGIVFKSEFKESIERLYPDGMVFRGFDGKIYWSLGVEAVTTYPDDREGVWVAASECKKNGKYGRPNDNMPVEIYKPEKGFAVKYGTNLSKKELRILINSKKEC